MTAIKDLKNLEHLHLHYNNLTQLKESDFTNLTSLKKLIINKNLIEDLTVQIFAGAKNLTNLYVQNFTSYENINSTLPKLKSLMLSTDHWNCTYLESVARILNNQNIYLDFDLIRREPKCVWSRKKVNSISDPENIRHRLFNH